MATTKVTPADVAKTASLANLTVSDSQKEVFADQFSATIDVINQLNELDTSNLKPTAQVTNLTNISRPDVIDTDRILSQEIALSQAKNTHNGFFVVPQLIDKND
jgi:aspartyl-tRNA(Asn)/glutamyl-tRNA(Gln) amidotransferase subunit C